MIATLITVCNTCAIYFFFFFFFFKCNRRRLFFLSKQQQKEDPQKKLTKCVKKERLLQKLDKTTGKPSTTLPSDVFALIDEPLSHDKLGHKPKKKLAKCVNERNRLRENLQM
jgi:hypothetical protein